MSMNRRSFFRRLACIFAGVAAAPLVAEPHDARIRVGRHVRRRGDVGHRIYEDAPTPDGPWTRVPYVRARGVKIGGAVSTWTEGAPSPAGPWTPL